MTLLCDPVERTLSHHRYVTHERLSGQLSPLAPRRPRWEPRLPPELTLVESIQERYLPDNLQTRMHFRKSSHEEMKQHTGEGLGGVVGLVIWILIGIVSIFVIPSEVGKMYRRDGREPPVTGWTGLWLLLPLAGGIVWFVKVQGALNRYWESKASQAGVAAAMPATG